MTIKQILLTTLFTISSLTLIADEYYVVTSDLNVRAGAGKNYPVSFTLQKGEEVEVLSKNSSWYKISYLGKAGYVHSKYLEYSRTTSDVSQETLKQVVPNLFIGVFAIIVLLIGFFIFIKTRDRKMLKTVTEHNRGTRSERDLVLKLLKYGMPAGIIFHDLYVKKQSGGFSQIDLVAVTDFGIIVFEVKDYSGWLYGTGNQQQWTKVLAYGKQKYRFYNPILQNSKHVTELKKQLIRYENLPFYSIVVFYGNCVLKEINFVPNGTFLVKPERVLDVLKMIFKENKPVDYNNKDEVFRILKEAVSNGKMIENQTQHNENIKDMLGKHRIFD